MSVPELKCVVYKDFLLTAQLLLSWPHSLLQLTLSHSQDLIWFSLSLVIICQRTFLILLYFQVVLGSIVPLPDEDTQTGPVVWGHLREPSWGT